MTGLRPNAYFNEERSELVCWTAAVEHVLLGTVEADWPVLGLLCLVCGAQVAVGDLVSAVPCGPASPEHAHAAERGESFLASAALVHTRCAERGRAS